MYNNYLIYTSICYKKSVFFVFFCLTSIKFDGISALVIDEIWLTVPFEITSLPLRGSWVVVR